MVAISIPDDAFQSREVRAASFWQTRNEEPSFARLAEQDMFLMYRFCRSGYQEFEILFQKTPPISAVPISAMPKTKDFNTQSKREGIIGK